MLKPWRYNLYFLEEAAKNGLRLYPMASVNPKGIHFTFIDTFVFDEMPTFRAMMAKPLQQKIEILRDPVARAQFRVEWANPTGRSLTYSWVTTHVAAVR